MGTRRGFLGKLLAIPFAAKAIDEIREIPEIAEEITELPDPGSYSEFICGITISFSELNRNAESSLRYIDLTKPEAGDLESSGDNDEL